MIPRLSDLLTLERECNTGVQGTRLVDELPQLDAETAEFQRECMSFAVDAETQEPSVYFLGRSDKLLLLQHRYICEIWSHAAGS